VRELLSEMRGEEGGLATAVGGECQHLVETGDLPGLSFEGRWWRGLARASRSSGGRSQR
jgi:hypothetical protein